MMIELKERRDRTKGTDLEMYSRPGKQTMSMYIAFSSRKPHLVSPRREEEEEPEMVTGMLTNMQTFEEIEAKFREMRRRRREEAELERQQENEPKKRRPGSTPFSSLGREGPQRKTYIRQPEVGKYTPKYEIVAK